MKPVIKAERVCTLEEVRRRLLLAIRSNGSQVGLARELGWNHKALNEVLAGRRSPSKSMLRFLGIQKLSIYIKL